MELRAGIASYDGGYLRNARSTSRRVLSSACVLQRVLSCWPSRDYGGNTVKKGGETLEVSATIGCIRTTYSI